MFSRRHRRVVWWIGATAIAGSAACTVTRARIHVRDPTRVSIEYHAQTILEEGAGPTPSRAVRVGGAVHHVERATSGAVLVDGSVRVAANGAFPPEYETLYLPLPWRVDAHGLRLDLPVYSGPPRSWRSFFLVTGRENLREVRTRTEPDYPFGALLMAMGSVVTTGGTFVLVRGAMGDSPGSVPGGGVALGFGAAILAAGLLITARPASEVVYVPHANPRDDPRDDDQTVPGGNTSR